MLYQLIISLDCHYRFICTIQDCHYFTVQIHVCVRSECAGWNPLVSRSFCRFGRRHWSGVKVGPKQDKHFCLWGSEISHFCLLAHLGMLLSGWNHMAQHGIMPNAFLNHKQLELSLHHLASRSLMSLPSLADSDWLPRALCLYTILLHQLISFHRSCPDMQCDAQISPWAG